MRSLQGPFMCPAVRPTLAGAFPMALNRSFMKRRFLRSECWGNDARSAKAQAVAFPSPSYVGKCKSLQCMFGSSSDGTGSTAENFDENDEDYVNSSVVEAVEVKSGADGFMIKLRDGRNLRCVQNNPQGGYVPDYTPHPAIVLKMEDGSGLLLPIIVLELPSVLLMAALKNVQMARPTMYQVVKDMVDKMGYEVRLVRVTKRVHEAYFARLFLTKAGSESESVNFDLRPSDAINIAVRCKAPIQVNNYIAYNDGLGVIDSGKLPIKTPASDGSLFTELDQPSSQPCIESIEFNLVNNMLQAVGEERYDEAAEWRDKLDKFRGRRNPKKFT